LLRAAKASQPTKLRVVLESTLRIQRWYRHTFRTRKTARKVKVLAKFRRNLAALIKGWRLRSQVLRDLNVLVMRNEIRMLLLKEKNAPQSYLKR